MVHQAEYICNGGTVQDTDVELSLQFAMIRSTYDNTLLRHVLTS